MFTPRLKRLARDRGSEKKIVRPEKRSRRVTKRQTVYPGADVSLRLPSEHFLGHGNEPRFNIFAVINKKRSNARGVPSVK